MKSFCFLMFILSAVIWIVTPEYGWLANVTLMIGLAGFSVCYYDLTTNTRRFVVSTNQRAGHMTLVIRDRFHNTNHSLRLEDSVGDVVSVHRDLNKPSVLIYKAKHGHRSVAQFEALVDVMERKGWDLTPYHFLDMFRLLDSRDTYFEGTTRSSYYFTRRAKSLIKAHFGFVI